MGVFLSHILVFPRKSTGGPFRASARGLTALMDKRFLQRLRSVSSFIPTCRDYSDSAAVPKAALLKASLAAPSRGPYPFT